MCSVEIRTEYLLESGRKNDEVTAEWVRIQNEELYDTYCTLIFILVTKSRKMRWDGHVACMEDWRGAHWGLVGRLEGKRLLGRPRGRWEDNI
jgi:hypothetical protein